ncbi:MAG: hypothetical protein N2320_01485 [Candidatus Bipolaricaulota bacterium]|nr:hypothetical protein [Candidatus Bipolaricaulota bacterium]
MKKLGTLGALVALLGAAGLGQGMSGWWTSSLTFSSQGVSLSSAFTLHLTGPGWQLASTFDPTLRGPSVHSLTLEARFGAWTVEAGASVLLPPAARFARAGSSLWATSSPVLQSGFVSVELALGNLTLRLSFQAGPGELGSPPR